MALLINYFSASFDKCTTTHTVTDERHGRERKTLPQELYHVIQMLSYVHIAEVAMCTVLKSIICHPTTFSMVTVNI